MAPQHVFITGQPGVGKSTLIQKVLDQLSHTHELKAMARGFYTEEVRAGGERIGFDVVTLDGRRAPLSRAGTAARGAPTVGKYVVDVPSFERLALPELQLQPGVQLYVVDEVGKMELFSSCFYPAVTALLDAAPLVIGTVPVARYGRTIPQVEAIKQRFEVQVVSITKESRDREAQAVLATVRQRLAATAGSGGKAAGG